MHVNHAKRYDVGRAANAGMLAKVRHVNLDTLVFNETESGPSDDLALQFEAICHMPEEEKRIIKALLDGMIIKYQTKQMLGNLSS